MHYLAKRSTAWLALALLAALPAQAWAAAQARLVVVHEGGRMRTVLLPLADGRLAKAASAACADAGVMFAFTEEALPSAAPVISRSDRVGQVGVRVTLTCANLEPVGVELTYGIQQGAGPVGYVVNPQARVSLSGAGSGAMADFRVDIPESAPAQDEHFTLRREAGQFSGEMHGVPMLGTIAAADAPILRATITGAILPSQPPDGLGGRGDDPWAPGIYRDLHGFCSAPERRAGPECQALARLVAEGDTDGLIQVLRAVSPEKATALAPSSVGLMTTQIGNVAMRISQLLHGLGGGLDASGLALAGGGGSFTLGEVLNAGEDPNEEQRTLLGGTRWGLWINGMIGAGDAARHAGNAGFEFDNWSLTGGVDYRLTDTLFFGVASGFSRLSSEFGGGRDRLDANTRALHLYGGFSGLRGLSLDGSVSWVRSRFDLDRYLPGPGSTDLLQLDSLVQGSPDAVQRAAALGATWYLQSDIWTIAPMLQYQWIGTRVDAFEERGASIFRLAYSRQDLVTRSLSGGLYGDVTLATGVGSFRPYGRALWYANSGSGARNLLAEFVEGGAPMNAVVAAEPDRSYATLELGLGFRRPIGTRTVDFNLGALKLFGHEDAERWSVRGDVRIPF